MVVEHVQDFGAVVRQFKVSGELRMAEPTGMGHIHRTWLVVCASPGGEARFILQQLNTGVFTRPIELMENMERVTAHLAASVAGQPDPERRALRLIRTHQGQSWHCDEHGRYWRMFPYIAGTRACTLVDAPGEAFQAGRAFGVFQQQMATLPPPRLHETIPGFHDTAMRFAALERAMGADTANRAVLAKPEIAFALARKSLVGVLPQAGLPERITHNDTKIDNVLLDEKTGEALCVIDLDTVMPGLALFDFGDMVRTATTGEREDEPDLSRIELRPELFEALLRGYLEAAGNLLTAAEREYLVFSGKLITFEMGIRFLADYLNGDTYYTVHREAHNLDRCRAQFKLIQSMERQEPALMRLVRSVK